MQNSGGRVYLSPGIMASLAAHPEYMHELITTAASVMSDTGATTENTLLHSDTQAIQEGHGTFSYHFTSSCGDIIILGTVETGDIHILNPSEAEQIDTLQFTDIMSQPPDAFI